MSSILTQLNLEAKICFFFLTFFLSLLTWYQSSKSKRALLSTTKPL